MSTLERNQMMESIVNGFARCDQLEISARIQPAGTWVTVSNGLNKSFYLRMNCDTETMSISARNTDEDLQAFLQQQFGSPQRSYEKETGWNMELTAANVLMILRQHHVEYSV